VPPAGQPRGPLLAQARLSAMAVVDMRDAGAKLSELVAAAERGEEVIITRSGTPAARLVPVRIRAAPVRLGRLQGEIELGPDFDAPLPELGDSAA
jgi:prevent-host-death family protein